MIRRIGVGLALALTLSLLAVAAPAQADPPPPNPPCPEPVNGFCVSGEIPYTVFENPQPPPIPQQDTGNSGTGQWAEGEQQVSYPCYNVTQRESGIPASGGGTWTVQRRTCVEDLPGGMFRNKFRITFYYDGPTGRTTAYGNVRWDTKWTTPAGPPTRRIWAYNVNTLTWHIIGYTDDRPDAIQVHSTVGYSDQGCKGYDGYLLSRTRTHYVRMPNGVLYGPVGHDTASPSYYTTVQCPN